MAKTGRPSGYKPEFVEQAQKLCRLGATDAELADFFGTSVASLYRWKSEHDEFRDALKVGKEEADERVKRSLFSRATGYEHDDIDIRVIDKQVVQTPIRKYFPPDTTACIFWLKNRQPAEWRDKVETGVTDKDGNDVLPVAPEEMARRIAFVLQQAAEARVH